jgi:hypothetical protein
LAGICTGNGMASEKASAKKQTLFALGMDSVYSGHQGGFVL